MSGLRVVERLAEERPLGVAEERVVEETNSAGQRAKEIAFVKITLESFNLCFERELTRWHKWLLIRENDRFTVF